MAEKSAGLCISIAEEESGTFFKEFLPTEEYFSQRKQHTADISYDEVWNTIHRGSMPELQDNLDFNWQMFYGAYVRTYIERDVRELSEIVKSYYNRGILYGMSFGFTKTGTLI